MNKKCNETKENSAQSCSCENHSDSYVIPEINVDDFQRFVEQQEYNQEEHLRVYTIKTAEAIDGEIHQEGSAPNFKGDITTLSTCKHDMRKTLYKNHWKGGQKNLWIAGFATSELRKKGFSDSILLFLGRVEQIYETFYEAWNQIDENIRSEKNAKKFPLGDLYRPKRNLNDRSKKPNDYKICGNHSHKDNGFKKDVTTGLIFVFHSEKTFVFGPDGREIYDKEYFEEKTGLDGYLTERNRIDRYGRITNLGDFIDGIKGDEQA